MSIYLCYEHNGVNNTNPDTWCPYCKVIELEEQIDRAKGEIASVHRDSEALVWKIAQLKLKYGED